MAGIAQILFNKRCGIATKSHINWPIIDKCVEYGYLSHIDSIFTQRILKNYPNANEDVAICICYLISCARDGHLCIKVDEDVYPNPLWISLKNDFSQEIKHLINKMIIEGANKLPNDLVEKRNILSSKPFYKIGSYLYLQRNWYYETLFSNEVQRIYESKPLIYINEKKVLSNICTQKLLEEQKDAIIYASQNTLSIITGGPGTGKTYTVGHLIQALINGMQEEDRNNCEIAIAAPTGKAAANIQKSIAKIINSDLLPKLSPTTLHSLLKITTHTSVDSIRQTLFADIIIIDESSMIDVKMMAFLFTSIRSGSRIILLGDKDQLPPVESGNLFSDLIRCYTNSISRKNPIKVFTKCMRADLCSIVKFSQSINTGDTYSVLKYLNGSHLEIKKMPLETSIEPYIETYFLHNSEDFNHFRILSPLRKGPYGAEEINAKILKHILNLKKKKLMLPIMIEKNDYTLDLFNGEIGMLYCNANNIFNNSANDFALFPNKTNPIPAILLPKFSLAYCISIHKSQGSEFDHVLIILPEGSEIFGRKAIYTAVTRAKKTISIHSSDITIKKVISQDSSRLSGIASRSLF